MLAPSPRQADSKVVDNGDEDDEDNRNGSFGTRNRGLVSVAL
jgi:hypothetical protein